jgi:serine/threonine-protein kinase
VDTVHFLFSLDSTTSTIIMAANAFDSTVRLDGAAPDGRHLLDELAEPEGSRRLLTFHGSREQPVPPQLPSDPPQNFSWNARYEVLRLLGHGSQGVVYLARREGVDAYFTNVALKVFYPNPAFTREAYSAEMRRIALQAQRVSQIQHDSLISIRDFVALDESRIMVLEWVDGLDLAQLLRLSRFQEVSRRLDRWNYRRLTNVITTPGEDHCRLKPGIAVDILRGCLAGLSALHHAGIVHCDLKPSNIMIKRSGAKKIIDIDSSCVPGSGPPEFRGTPYYMAPEQLQGTALPLSSDIASLGYILIEMLTGRLLFREYTNIPALLQAKLDLPRRLNSILPDEVLQSSLLRDLVSKMVAVDPRDRFADADAADLDQVGAVSFHNQLVKTNLSTEYGRELAWWLELLDRETADGERNDER